MERQIHDVSDDADDRNLTDRVGYADQLAAVPVKELASEDENLRLGGAASGNPTS